MTVVKDIKTAEVIGVVEGICGLGDPFWLGLPGEEGNPFERVPLDEVVEKHFR